MEKEEKYGIIYVDAEHKPLVYSGQQRGGYGYTKEQLSVAIGELLGKGVEELSIFPVKFVKGFKLQIVLDE